MDALNTTRYKWPYSHHINYSAACLLLYVRTGSTEHNGDHLPFGSSLTEFEVFGETIRITMTSRPTAASPTVSHSVGHKRDIHSIFPQHLGNRKQSTQNIWIKLKCSYILIGVLWLYWEDVFPWLRLLDAVEAWGSMQDERIRWFVVVSVICTQDANEWVSGGANGEHHKKLKVMCPAKE